MAAPTEGARQRAVAEVESMGLAALAGVCRYIDERLRTDDPAYETMMGLRRRLAWCIREIVIGKGSAAPNAAFRAFLKEVQGKPLTGSRFAAIHKRVIAQPPPRVHGIRLRVVRPGDRTGALLIVTLQSDTVHQPGTLRDWITSLYVVKEGHGAGSVIAGSSVLAEDDGNTNETALRALRAEPDVHMELLSHLNREH